MNVVAAQSRVIAVSAMDIVFLSIFSIAYPAADRGRLNMCRFSAKQKRNPSPKTTGHVSSSTERLFQVRAQGLTVRGMAEFLEHFRFNLPDAFARNPELFANLF